jgi:hypothetical protein
MMRLSLFFAAALGACAPQPALPDQAKPSPIASAPSPALIASLAGEWRVAGIDGQPFDEPYGLALSGSDTELWWSPRCAGFARSYRIDGARVRFSRVAGTPASDGRPAPACLIAVYARLGAVFVAIDAADRVVRTPANGIEISGGGHSLLLFSQ